MREKSETFRILESLAWSNGCVTAREETGIGSFFAYINDHGVIIMDKAAYKRRDRAYVLAHELGHFFVEENAPRDIGILIPLVRAYNFPEGIYIIEALAWKMAEYCLCSTGLLSKRQRKAFLRAKKRYLQTYRKDLSR